MIRRALGKTGIEVSALCFGSLTVSPLQRGMSAERGAALLEYAIERGVNMVDTAELYQTYPHIAIALKRYPKLVVATKSYAHDKKTAERSFAGAVRGLQREYIDIFLLHEQESAHTLRGHARALEWLRRKKDEGAIGAVGVSTHYVAGVDAAVRAGADVIHPIVNVAGIGIQDGTRADMEAAIARASAAGVGVYAMKALGGGHLIARRAEAMAYAYALPGVSSVAVGLQSQAEIDWHARFIQNGRADVELDAAVAASPRELIVQNWCVGCGECVKRCPAGALKLVDGKDAVAPEKCVLCGYCAAACGGMCLKII